MSKTVASMQTSLTNEQRHAVGLLSIGTFLEYFDLMLYVHMAVLLNELFFPQVDIHIKSLITAAAFCSTYIMRPFGALVFGYIGDNFGRKFTLILTTLLMSFCCLVMTVLPTYAEIGILASIFVTLCRMLQGMSSMGEIVGAQLYLTEFIKIPARYPAVASIALAASIGAFAALGLASIVLSNENLSWRVAFGIGAFIASVGWFARSSLRETAEFSDARERYKNLLAKANVPNNSTLYNAMRSINVRYKTILSLFALDCMWPLCFYFVYIYCAEILQNVFNYSAIEVVHNNFIVSIFQIGMDTTFILLCRVIHPLKILQIKAIIVGVLFLIFPIFISWASSGFYIMAFQCVVVLSAPDAHNGVSSLYTHFPVLQRFTYSSFVYALSRAVVYVITAFGFIYIFRIFGHWGITSFALVMLTIYLIGQSHFVALERKLNHPYPFVRV